MVLWGPEPGHEEVEVAGRRKGPGVCRDDGVLHGCVFLLLVVHGDVLQKEPCWDLQPFWGPKPGSHEVLVQVCAEVLVCILRPQFDILLRLKSDFERRLC